MSLANSPILCDIWDILGALKNISEYVILLRTLWEYLEYYRSIAGTLATVHYPCGELCKNI